MNADFDPIDLALLAAGWSDAGRPMSLNSAEHLQGVAQMLHRLWVEMDFGEKGWPGVWAYEIAEPLGAKLAEHHAHERYSLAFAEESARRLIAAELGASA